jgi:hypothetical protein
MLEELLVNNVWLAIAVWIIVYTLNYQLTITSAKLYQAGAKDYFRIEGSVELTPIYQKDVDALRRFSTRALGIVIFFSLLLAAMDVSKSPGGASLPSLAPPSASREGVERILVYEVE